MNRQQWGYGMLPDANWTLNYYVCQQLKFLLHFCSTLLLSRAKARIIYVVKYLLESNIVKVVHNNILSPLRILYVPNQDYPIRDTQSTLRSSKATDNF